MRGMLRRVRWSSGSPPISIWFTISVSRSRWGAAPVHLYPPRGSRSPTNRSRCNLRILHFVHFYFVKENYFWLNIYFFRPFVNILFIIFYVPYYIRSQSSYIVFMFQMKIIHFWKYTRIQCLMVYWRIKSSILDYF